MVDTLWLARHGNRQDYVDPDWMEHAERPYDPGLSTDGEEQVLKLVRRLRCQPFTAVFSSPFLRALETAHPVAEAVRCPLYIEPGLSEWLNAEWFPHTPRTLPPDALVDHFPRVDPAYRPLSGARYGETESEAMRRSAEAAHAIASAYSGAVLLVGHSVSVLGVAAGLVPGTDIPECGMCCLFKLTSREDAWRMDVCADVSHLQASSA